MSDAGRANTPALGICLAVAKKFHWTHDDNDDGGDDDDDDYDDEHDVLVWARFTEILPFITKRA